MNTAISLDLAARSTPCPDALSTAETSRCLESLLQKADQRLSDALVAVAAEALSIPGDTSQALWRENLTGFSALRNSCAFAKSVGFQGTETLLKEMTP